MVKLISKEKIPMIIGVENYRENIDIYLGTSPVYQGVKIGANINQFFSNHFAILGSTGSGKSCGVARIIQNVFDKQRYIPYRLMSVQTMSGHIFQYRLPLYTLVLLPIPLP